MALSIPTQQGRRWQINPQAFPASASTLISQDVVLKEMHLCNNTGAAITVGVTDNQTPPIALVPSQSLLPGGMISMDSDEGRLMPGGIIITTSAPGIHGWMRGWI